MYKTGDEQNVVNYRLAALNIINNIYKKCIKLD